MAPSLVDSTLGAWEVGVMIMMFLYGVLASQTWSYYNSGSAGDRFLVRIIVRVFISATESLHSIMICVAIYQHTITSFGDITQIDVPTWTANSTFPIARLTIGIAFFAWRIYCISHRWIITLVAWLGSLVRLGSSLAVAVVSTEMVEASKFIENYKWLPIVCLGVGAMTDILITLALCWFLWKSQPRFRRSKKIVDTLILWTVGASDMFPSSLS
ncbi:uncharacterized protein STEHIDRAFT_49566 [Stereum hirsutum FP-91666 SS1]|uniref:uncharacterized protein n=1 Tax=Stereum hirsutum (strain FP-91666) TaxID=721885 RepID=UPI000440BBCF|nr:uncharacterized protein STEHIDRAFT_49566 [Stereum hirsutum FP-91666 SS1]EIM90661.1 hypothetical protein STEHIDRAFT_49566 [Stereum hirsutum FP-91666 SS1]